VLVFGTYDMALAPWFTTSAARRYVSVLAGALNRTLQRSTAQWGGGVRSVDLASLVHEWATEPGRFGLTFGSGVDACSQAGENYCTVAGQRSRHAHRDHLFAGSVHFTTAGHHLIAEHVLRHHLRGW
jgi:phospholipase/lecithinase/hemolysin